MTCMTGTIKVEVTACDTGRGGSGFSGAEEWIVKAMWKRGTKGVEGLGGGNFDYGS